MDALADPQFDFRSASGISASTGVPRDVVLRVMNKNAAKIRVSPVPDSDGNTLYTLKSRPHTLREIVSEALAFASGSAR